MRFLWRRCWCWFVSALLLLDWGASRWRPLDFGVGLVWFGGVEVWERKEEEWSSLVRLSAVCILSSVRTAVHCDIESKCEMNAQRWDPYSSWVQQPSESRFVVPAASGYLCFYSTYYLYPVQEKEVLQCEERSYCSGVILLLREAFWWDFGSPLYSCFQAIHKFVQYFVLADGSIRVLLCF